MARQEILVHMLDSGKIVDEKGLVRTMSTDALGVISRSQKLQEIFGVGGTSKPRSKGIYSVCLRHNECLHAHNLHVHLSSRILIRKTDQRNGRPRLQSVLRSLVGRVRRHNDDSQDLPQAL